MFISVDLMISTVCGVVFQANLVASSKLRVNLEVLMISTVFGVVFKAN